MGKGARADAISILKVCSLALEGIIELLKKKSARIREGENMI